MAALSTIIGAVAALGSLAAGASQFAKGSGNVAVQPQAAPMPRGLDEDLTPDALVGKYDPTKGAPNFLQFGSGMTNAQKRAQISTFGANGADSRYTDPAAKDYWKNLLLQDYSTARQRGGEFSLLPSEKQYAEKVFGAKPKMDTNESFLSAILKG